MIAAIYARKSLEQTGATSPARRSDARGANSTMSGDRLSTSHCSNNEQEWSGGEALYV